MRPPPTSLYMTAVPTTSNEIPIIARPQGDRTFNLVACESILQRMANIFRKHQCTAETHVSTAFTHLLTTWAYSFTCASRKEASNAMPTRQTQLENSNTLIQIPYIRATKTTIESASLDLSCTYYLSTFIQPSGRSAICAFIARRLAKQCLGLRRIVAASASSLHTVQMPSNTA
uniref:Uncharacterized protein n=1 Tax=Schistocephalus solidus TaxID=70667 RepID=A0A0V0JCF9_SCHSO